jgi:prepilin-type N-terminal cleavage/methylation domain-containing protein
MKAPVQAGVSLVELLVVITILGFAAMLAIPGFSTSDHAKLELAAEEYAQAIRYARSLAMQQGAPFGFRNPPGADDITRIRVFRVDTTTNPWTPIYDVTHPLSKNLYAIDLKSHRFAFAESVNRTISFRGACNVVGNTYFDANGTPWCADPEDVLLEQLDITFSSGPVSRVVTLHGLSGRVTIQ